MTQRHPHPSINGYKNHWFRRDGKWHAIRTSVEITLTGTGGTYCGESVLLGKGGVLCVLPQSAVTCGTCAEGAGVTS